MDSSSMWHLIALIFLLGGSAFFSASETALMSLSKIRVRHMVEENIRGAQSIEKVIENPSKLLSTILIGNNVVNIGASALATALALELFGSKGVGIATGMMTVLVLVFGEITPKSLAAQNSEKVSLKFVNTIIFLMKILSPIVKVFTYVTSGLIKLLGGDANKYQPVITQEELRTMVNVGHEEGVLEVEEKQMIDKVFEFGDLYVKDVMVQRRDIVAVDFDSTYKELIDIVKEEQFSRYPIYREKMDNIIGFLNVRDLFLSEDAEEKFRLEKYIREPFYTFEFKKIAEVFKEMKKARTHMGIVLDEYGSTAGIITIEDLIEEIVGDIEDEYDDHEEEIVLIKEDEYIIDGSTRLDKINEMIGTYLESENYDSLGGFIIGELGRFPVKNETIEYNGITFIIEDVNKTRIIKVRVLT
ncbi:HlyC/CorC family transporter [Anaerosolibacter sp.]|uniref:HlyC/CorC family transporter n=1 Tax=Anaerosolibacter sp. TaxID=1872527 RepID=UPI0039EEE6F8